RAVAGVALIAVVAGTAALGWGWPAAVRGGAASAAGLLAADLLRRAAKRRLGGMTGDVFGALIEAGTTTMLLVLALAPCRRRGGAVGITAICLPQGMGAFCAAATAAR